MIGDGGYWPTDTSSTAVDKCGNAGHGTYPNNSHKFINHACLITFSSLFRLPLKVSYITNGIREPYDVARETTQLAIMSTVRKAHEWKTQ
jgi:hypothetical protein